MYRVQCDPHETADNICKRFARLLDVPNNIGLLYGGRMLTSDATLAGRMIPHNAIIHVLEHLRGDWLSELLIYCGGGQKQTHPGTNSFNLATTGTSNCRVSPFDTMCINVTTPAGIGGWMRLCRYVFLTVNVLFSKCFETMSMCCLPVSVTIIITSWFPTDTCTKPWPSIVFTAQKISWEWIRVSCAT